MILTIWAGLIGVAPAYGQYIALQEDFSTGSGSKAPNGWTQEILSGNSLYDSFFFSKNTYFFNQPIEEHFAFFDVYEGGVQKRSNGDGFAEQVRLFSPDIQVDSGKDWRVSFDYHFTRLRTPEFEVLWSADSGKTWISVWGDAKGTDLTKHIELNIPDSLLKSGHGKLACQWRTFNNATPQGYLALDNVMVFYRDRFDIKVVPDPLNRDVYCYNDQTATRFRVENVGTDDLSNIPLTWRIRFPGTDTSFRDTIAKVQKGDVKVFKVEDKIKLEKDRRYELMLYAGHDKDVLYYNDTARYVVIVMDTVPPPLVADGDRCGAGEVVLRSLSHAGDSAVWFDKKGTLMATGTKFQTPPLAKTDTFYAKTARSFPDSIPTLQGPYRFSTPSSGGAYIRFVAHQNLIIHTLAQHFSESGTYVSEVYMKKGDYRGFESDSTYWKKVGGKSDEAEGWGHFEYFSIQPIELEEGDTVSFHIAIKGQGVPSFKRTAYSVETSSADVYTANVTNKKFTLGGTLYSGLSWDGRIFFDKVCLSDQVPVIARIDSKPKGVVVSPATNFNGIFNHGTIDDMDQIPDAGQAAYDITCPKGRTNLDYGSKWSIGNIVVNTLSGKKVNDSLYYRLTPTKLDNYQLVFRPAGLYTDSVVVIRFTVFSYDNGCDTVISRYINISKLPEPKFDFDDACVGYEVYFHNTTSNFSGQEYTYLWDFGDRATATGDDQIHSYNSKGIFAVKLTAINPFGISGSTTKQIKILQVPAPSMDADFACEGEEIHLDALNVRTGESIKWLIDGKVFTGASSLDYGFSTAGAYVARLVVSNEACSDTVRRNVFQFASPKSSFISTGRCLYDTFNMTSSTKYNGEGSLGYKWLEGNRVIGTQTNWKGRFNSPGLKSVKLITSSQFQCSDTVSTTIEVLTSPKADFDLSTACFDGKTEFYNQTKDTAGLGVTYQWSFGDGQFSTEINPVNSYQNIGDHRVVLRVTANNGCSDRKDTTIVVSVKPNANFSVTEGCDGQGVVFTNYSEFNNKELSYEWKFGDGTSSTIHSPIHVYRVSETTTFNASLTVKSGDGECTDTYTRPVTVHSVPSCEFEAIQSTADRTLWKFVPEATDSLNLQYTWIFEGSGASVDPTPSHRFAYPDARYRVILSIRSGDGCACIDSSTQITTSWSLSARQIAKESLVSLTPNPAVSVVTIRAQQGHLPVNGVVRILDITGKPVTSQPLGTNSRNGLTLNVSGLAEGYYLVDISGMARVPLIVVH